MSVDECVHCRDFPCADVDHSAYVLPALELDPSGLISEVAPASPDDWFYASGEPLFAQTTLQAFRDAGEEVSSLS
jgi:hypothetical protein